MQCSECGMLNFDEALQCAECGTVFLKLKSGETKSTKPQIATKSTQMNPEYDGTTTEQIRELMQQLGMIKN